MVLPSLSGRRSRVAAITAVSLPMLTIGAPLAAQEDPSSLRITDVTAAFSRQSIDEIIAEAAQRFAIPERWIRAVMQAESAGDPTAVSDAGAMGLMQIMPATWADLRAAHGLGDDAFDPRDNVLAGAAYLREMYDRFGAPGFLAAYNAGPERYAEHLATGRPLPRETRAYVAALAPSLPARRTFLRRASARRSSSNGAPHRSSSRESINVQVTNQSPMSKHPMDRQPSPRSRISYSSKSARQVSSSIPRRRIRNDRPNRSLAHDGVPHRIPGRSAAHGEWNNGRRAR
ncbi:MAG: hypothetical protein Kilf2KO_47030 [Rhodospirillales bacterium]